MISEIIYKCRDCDEIVIKRIKGTPPSELHETHLDDYSLDCNHPFEIQKAKATS